MLIKFNYY